MPEPAITAVWTPCAGPAGVAKVRCRGPTNPTAASCALLAALAWAAEAIGETDEAARCAGFLRDSSREAAEALGL